MTSFTEPTRSTSSFSGDSKNVSPFSQFLRHGKEPTMGELADYTFQSVVFSDGTTLENLTFEQLSDIVWTNINKS